MCDGAPYLSFSSLVLEFEVGAFRLLSEHLLVLWLIRDELCHFVVHLLGEEHLRLEVLAKTVT